MLRILQELSEAKAKGISLKTVNLRNKLEKEGVTTSTFYSILRELSDKGFIYPLKTGRMSVYSITDEGEKNLQLLLQEIAPSKETIISSIQEEFDSILKRIRDELANISLNVGRRQVWERLAGAYARARHELLIMGQGADISTGEIEQEIKQLKEATEEKVKQGVFLRRVQSIYTWSSWLKWLSRIAQYPNVELYFTIEHPKFIPQLNIIDTNELILVPIESSSKFAHSFHITDTKLIEYYRQEFHKWTSEPLSKRVNNKIIEAYSEILSKINLLRLQCATIAEFTAFSAYKPIEKIEEKLLPSIGSIAETFPMDRCEYNDYCQQLRKVLSNVKTSKIFKERGATLSEAFSIFFEHYFKSYDTNDSVEAIMKFLPPLASEALDKSILKRYFFEDDLDLRDKALRALEYFSNGLRRIFENTYKRLS